MKSIKMRHGDVVLEAVKAPSEDQLGNPVKARSKGMTLADGELTGHSHYIAQGASQLYEAKPEEKTADPLLVGLLHVTEKAGARLAHEEHTTSSVPHGWYKIRVKRQYNPEGSWARVQD